MFIGSVSEVGLLYGKDVDGDVVVPLLERATTMLFSRVGRVWTDPVSVPEPLHLAVSQAVANFLGCRDSQADGDAVRAEQIGDYRVEYSRPRQVSGVACFLDLDAVEPLWGRFRLKSYSVTTPVALDGVDAVGGWNVLQGGAYPAVEHRRLP